MIAKSPVYTGSDTNLGIKSEMRKKKVKMLNPAVVQSQFGDDTDRRNAMVDIFTILYNSINPDYRMRRKQDIWGDFKSRVLSAAGSKSKQTFLTRYAKSYQISVFDTHLIELMDLFNNHEFLYYIRDNVDDLLLRMRFQRERKNQNYDKLKELETAIQKNLSVLSSLESDGIFTDEDQVEEIKKKIDEQYEEQKALETDQTMLCNVDTIVRGESKLSYTQDFHEVPYFTGNSIGGILRRLVMEDFFNRAGIDKTYDFAYHTLFTGGVLKIETKDQVIADYMTKSRNIINASQDKIKLGAKATMAHLSPQPGVVDFDMIDEITFVCPALRLFGAAIGNMMIESEMIISNAELICAENNNGETSMWGLLDDIFFTRHDSSKSERDIELVETSDDTHQMKYIMETVIKGAEFEHEFVCKSDNKLIKAAFHKALDLFVDYPVIGGKSSRGLGQIDLTELSSQIDDDLVEYYESHIEQNKEFIRGFFDVAAEA
ncbi:MAG: hypothetical protein ACOC4D_00015 [Bacteroidota bacterium]